MSLVGGYPGGGGSHYYGGTTALHSHDSQFYTHHQNLSTTVSSMGVGRYPWAPHPTGNSHHHHHHPHHQMEDIQPWVTSPTTANGQHSTVPSHSGLQIPQGTTPLVDHLGGFAGVAGGMDTTSYPAQGYGLTYAHQTSSSGTIPMYNMMGEEIGVGVSGKVRVVKRKVSANKKERRRTISINTAFSSLRGCIPNVPTDTKLSKIKTLRLATSYIAYLMDVLNKDDPTLTERDFKAEVPKRAETVEERRLAQEKEMLRVSQKDEKRSRGRTGWPQAVWASELKTESAPGSGNSSSGEQEAET